MSDETSTRVEEPITLELTWFEQGLADAVDFWREEARSWRTRCWIAAGFGLIGWLGWAAALFAWVTGQ